MSILLTLMTEEKEPTNTDFETYETLSNTSVATHMTAGAIAGIMEHCVMYPLDSVKTRMQSLSPTSGGQYRSILDTLSRMVRSEGIFRPVRGMSAVVVGAGPAHAMYFSIYERIKAMLLSYAPPGYGTFLFGSNICVAGCVATVFHDALMTPADVVKQRMQMHNSAYRSCWECVMKTYKAEGYRAFYRSYSTQLFMNIPFQTIHFMTYEFMQKNTNKENVYNPKAHMISGAFAGGLAAAITTPLDVCKTLLNTQETTVVKSLGQSQIRGLLFTFTTVYRLAGFRGYFQGMSARVMYQVPSTAICWSVYEFFKYAIGQHDFSR